MTDMIHPGLYPFDIRSSDTDFNDRLQVSSLFALMQESAYHHAEQINIGTQLLDGLDLTWMLSRISVRLEYLPHWRDKIWIRTWSRGARKLLFERDFEFFAGSPDGEPFGRASSDWLVVRRDNHRPQRPEQILGAAGWTMAHAGQTGIPAVFDFPCPKIDSLLDPVCYESNPRKPDLVKYADFSEIDRNRHVNNTRYIAWCMDAAYAHFTGGLQHLEDPATPALALRALDINYLAEIRPGERIHLFVDGESPSSSRTIVVEGLKSDRWAASFRARLQFASS